MDKRAFTAAIIVSFTAIVFLMHIYTFSRLASFFNLPTSSWFYWSLALLSLFFVFATIFERFVDGLAGKAVYIGAAVWLGAVFFLFFCTLAFDLLRLIFGINPFATGILALLSGAAAVGFGLYNGAKLIVSEIEVPIHELQQPLTIVQVSDVHLGAVRGADYSQLITDTVNGLKPDFVLFTGDLADGSGDFTKEIVEPFGKLEAPAYFVTGNHENYLDAEYALKVIRHTKIKPLRGEVVSAKGLQIVGFDYPMEGSGDTLANAIKRVKFRKDEPVVLMYHAAQELEAAKLAGIDLMLTGHVHGGQILPFNLFVRILFPYTHGLHHYKNMKVFVSQGAGTWGPPMRLGSRNEINLIKLVKA